MKPSGNTPAGQKHAQQIDAHVQQTKTYGGHLGITDPGAQGVGDGSRGGYSGTGGQGGAGGANYTTTNCNDSPGPDAGPDGA